ncbi:CCR4-NOT transcription complex subunit 7 isoform X1 [Bemisia tabaci]|uniref:CCR4-NOT transcription complex subunit 7 isoform X1 n=1 Tax=Bemisia tabaci TaxID=7038 RepID=UPI0008F9A210|nr:PREDICTED: CCR4-NOT transcription complex subunit 7 isoform X1 [Bemisia tabaci]
MPSATGNASTVGNTVSSGQSLTSPSSGNNQGTLVRLSNEECGIKDVWAYNMYDEFRTIRQIVSKYKYVAMDTEFPGVVARPYGDFKSNADFQYQLLKCNVDLLRIIQLGLTFLDEEGKTINGPYTTWQFNFKFNLSEDMYAQDSIDLLQNSGIQFKKHEEEGINPVDFAVLLMTSGIVLMDNVKFLSFHSGYDFGYLLKLLTNEKLPQEESEFFDILRTYFPVVYDVKYLMKSCKNLKGGLQEVADQLELARIGPQHQAGSDSLLTGMAFFKMREMFFEDNIDDAKYCGHLYGLGTSFIVNGNNSNSNPASTNATTNSSNSNSSSATTNANSGSANATNTNESGDSNNTS